MPALPADIPKDATIWMLLTDKTPAGQDAVWTTPDGVVHEFFQFNDRGRGPEDVLHLPSRQQGHPHLRGNHRRRLHEEPGEREFQRSSGGSAKWKNSSEDGQQANAAGRFYVGLTAGPRVRLPA